MQTNSVQDAIFDIFDSPLHDYIFFPNIEKAGVTTLRLL